MTPRVLSKKIHQLPQRAPITDTFVIELTKLGVWNVQRESRKYSDQKAHWTGWLSEMDGPGYYNRKNWSAISAETVYRRIACPPMLLWLAETSGVSKAKLRLAKKRAIKAKNNFASQSAAIREVVPWPLVETALTK